MNKDLKIWKDFTRGEQYALEHIYHTYVDVLYRYGQKFTPDTNLIKDAIHDLFFDLIRTRSKLGETDNICFYLMRALRRRIAVVLQKAQSPMVSEDWQLEAHIAYSIEDELIDKELLTEREKIIRDALGKLQPRQREILYYRFTCNFDYDEICDLMNLKYDSARKLVFRSLQSLKRIYNATLMVGLAMLNLMQ